MSEKPSTEVVEIDAIVNALQSASRQEAKELYAACEEAGIVRTVMPRGALSACQSLGNREVIKAYFDRMQELAKAEEATRKADQEAENNKPENVQARREAELVRTAVHQEGRKKLNALLRSRQA